MRMQTRIMKGKKASERGEELTTSFLMIYGPFAESQLRYFYYVFRSQKGPQTGAIALTRMQLHGL